MYGRKKDLARGPVVTGRDASGFTLVELLVVMAIITLLAGILAVAVNYALKDTEGLETTARMTALAQGLRNYREDQHRYPGQDILGSIGPAANPGNYSGSQILAAAMLKYDYAYCGQAFVAGDGTSPAASTYIAYKTNASDPTDPINTLMTLDGRMHVLADGYSEEPKAICYYPSIPMAQGISQYSFAHNSIHTGSDNATFQAFITDGSLPAIGGIGRAYREGEYLLISAGHDRTWFNEDDHTNWKSNEQ